MQDPMFYATLSLTALAALTMLALVGLKGFTGWLDLKRAELGAAQRPEPGVPAAAARIDIADLKERIRKLEAIAAGVEL